MAQTESFKDWFTKQGIEHLWSDSVAENEEILLLLASEKQWDDIKEICSDELKLPKIKIAYLKAYLIKRTKAPTIPVETASPSVETNDTNDADSMANTVDNQSDDVNAEDDSVPDDTNSAKQSLSNDDRSEISEKISATPHKATSKKKKRNQRRKRNQKSKRDRKNEDISSKSATTSPSQNEDKKATIKDKEQNQYTPSNDTSISGISQPSSKSSKTSTSQSPIKSDELVVEVPPELVSEAVEPSEGSPPPPQTIYLSRTLTEVSRCVEYIKSLENDNEPPFESMYGRNGFEYNEVNTFENIEQMMNNLNTCCILKASLSGSWMDVWSTLKSVSELLERYISTEDLNLRKSHTLNIREFDTDRNYGGHSISTPYKTEKLSMVQFVDGLINRPKTTHFHARSTGKLAESVQHVFKDEWSSYLQIARKSKWGPLLRSILEIGTKSTVVPLHYKISERLLLQIHGTTEVVLFSPECSPFLYPFPYGHPCYQQSMVNIECPTSWSTFKYFKPENDTLGKNVYRVTVTPGDMLYIPSGWWVEWCNLNEIDVHLMMESKCGRNETNSLDIEQVLNRKTTAQRIAIGRNVERRVFAKYGNEGNVMMDIFKSFVTDDVKYLKHRNDITRMLRNVFNPHEIEAFLQELVDGRYTVDVNQFICRNEASSEDNQ